MRVLVIHNDYLLPGGETLTVNEQVDGLRSRGVDVRLLMVDNSRWESGRQLRAAVTVVYDRSAHRRVSDAVASFSPEVVHTHNLFPNLGAGAISAIGGAGIPWVQHLHNYRSSCLAANHFRQGADCLRCTKAATAVAGIRLGCYRGNRVHSAASAAYDIGRRTAMARSGSPTLYVAVSQSMRETMRQRYLPNAHIEVCHNTVDVMASRRALARATPRSGVIFVGRLVEEKGVRLAMAALDLLPGVPVTFLGDGPLFDEVGRWAEARPAATVERRRSPDEVLTSMASAQVALALPLWEEPFGRTSVEAMSVGTCVIGTSRGAMAELLAGERGVLLPDQPKAEDVAVAVGHCLDEPPAVTSARSESLTAYVSDTFGIAAGTDRLLGIYEVAIARGTA